MITTAVEGDEKVDEEEARRVLDNVEKDEKGTVNFESLISYFQSLNSYFQSLISYFKSLNSYFKSLNSYFQSLNSYFQIKLLSHYSNISNNEFDIPSIIFERFAYLKPIPKAYMFKISPIPPPPPAIFRELL